MSLIKKTGGKTIEIVKNLPRITLANLRPNPGAKILVSISYVKCYNANLLFSRQAKEHQILKTLVFGMQCTSDVRS